jgi:hypothetical protein
MSRRKNSAAIEDIVPNINLTKAEQLELQSLFKKTPPINGAISFYDLINILKSM